MKTKIIISFAALVLNISVIFASNNYLLSSHRPVELKPNSDAMYIIPSTPKEATFEDGMLVYKNAENGTLLASGLSNGNAEGPIMDAAFDYTVFAPVTPKEASFEDARNDEEVIITPALLKNLAPVTPREAYFSDNSICSGK
ncbi:MAG: hypothetical protein NTX61_17720 [Bacteroidetes bacterium]|nr:hypothetical protein [Bacteroidota bacterium]